MVTADWARLMARYNAWQNEGHLALVPALPPEELARDRGAFWGGILGTLSHLLWADRMWLSRLAGAARPPGTLGDSAGLVADAGTWAAARQEADAAVSDWAAGLSDADLAGDLTWTSGAAGRVVTRPVGLVAAHLFNHQAHHRGQVHAMLTAMGLRPPDTDLFLLPG